MVEDTLLDPYLHPCGHKDADEDSKLQACRVGEYKACEECDLADKNGISGIRKRTFGDDASQPAFGRTDPPGIAHVPLRIKRTRATYDHQHDTDRCSGGAEVQRSDGAEGYQRAQFIRVCGRWCGPLLYEFPNLGRQGLDCEGLCQYGHTRI